MQIRIQNQGILRNILLYILTIMSIAFVKIYIRFLEHNLKINNLLLKM
jgi:hypothetical protein